MSNKPGHCRVLRDEPPRSGPVFRSKREQREFRNRALLEAGKAFATMGRDKIDQDALVDMLTNLRFAAVNKRIIFYEALRISEIHHLVETGKLAEGWTSKQ